MCFVCLFVIFFVGFGLAFCVGFGAGGCILQSDAPADIELSQGPVYAHFDNPPSKVLKLGPSAGMDMEELQSWPVTKNRLQRPFSLTSLCKRRH